MLREDIERIAREYAAAPRVSDSVLLRSAYRALEAYALARFVDAVREGWVLYPEYSGAAPDLRLTQDLKRLGVYDEKHGHPLLSDRGNFAFRAVHDIFGHGLSRLSSELHDFGFDGECAAAEQQARDISTFGCLNGWDESLTSAVASAAWTEIVGQAAYFEVHGEFPEQKAALLPRLRAYTRGY